MKKKASINGTFGWLICICAYSIKKYHGVKKYIESQNVEALKKKDIINFGFVVYTSTMWNTDELYHLLDNNDRFKVGIIVAHCEMADEKASELEYVNTLLYFRNRGYRVYELCDVNDIKEYDILFYLSPFKFRENKINLVHLPTCISVLHTSYSYMLSGNMEKLNLWMYHLSMLYFTDSKFYKKKLENVSVYSGNAIYCGFPKMDQYYNSISHRFTSKKVIIYAPHHSVSYKKYKSATFESNYLEFLRLAEEFSDTTYWIYKPHPILKSNSVKAGIFKNTDEYDEYEEKWKALDNARVENSGDYFALFKASDAMITDSVSFLAEYQFTNKPLLLLESGEEVYNEFGNDILRILYKCPGNDIRGIKEFIHNVIEGKDDMKDIRMSFFEDNLQYMHDGISANKKIFNEIEKIVT